jgi:hypothetical protein
LRRRAESLRSLRLAPMSAMRRFLTLQSRGRHPASKALPAQRCRSSVNLKPQCSFPKAAIYAHRRNLHWPMPAVRRLQAFSALCSYVAPPAENNWSFRGIPLNRCLHAPGHSVPEASNVAGFETNTSVGSDCCYIVVPFVG